MRRWASFWVRCWAILMAGCWESCWARCLESCWVGCLARLGELVISAGRRLKECQGLGIVGSDGVAVGPAAQGVDAHKVSQRLCVV